jgi:Delta7-sterol 5-desaturase
MTTGIPPLDILLEKGRYIFAFDFGRYLIAASLTFAVVWLLRRTAIKARKIQAREATTAEMRREFFQSLQSALVYTVGAGFLIWGTQNGIFQKFDGSFGWGTDLMILAGIVIAHDAYFYWAHRTMHHPKLFKHFHRAHHRSITPTPWAAYSFAIPEAVVMFMFVPIWQFFVPTPGWVMFVWLNFQIIRNAMGHAGFELWALFHLVGQMDGDRACKISCKICRGRKPPAGKADGCRPDSNRLRRFVTPKPVSLDVTVATGIFETAPAFVALLDTAHDARFHPPRDPRRFLGRFAQRPGAAAGDDGGAFGT